MESTARAVVLLVIALVLIAIAACVVGTLRDTTRNLRKQQRDNAARLSVSVPIGAQGSEVQGRDAVHAVNAASMNAVRA